MSLGRYRRANKQPCSCYGDNPIVETRQRSQLNGRRSYLGSTNVPLRRSDVDCEGVPPSTSTMVHRMGVDKGCREYLVPSDIEFLSEVVLEENPTRRPVSRPQTKCSSSNGSVSISGAGSANHVLVIPKNPSQ